MPTTLSAAFGAALALAFIWRPYVEGRRALTQMRAEERLLALVPDDELVIALAPMGLATTDDEQFDWPHAGRWN